MVLLKRVPTPPELAHMPDYIPKLVMSYLDVEDRVSLSCTCRLMATWTHTKRLWESLVITVGNQQRQPRGRNVMGQFSAAELNVLQSYSDYVKHVYLCVSWYTDGLDIEPRSLSVLRAAAHRWKLKRLWVFSVAGHEVRQVPLVWLDQLFHSPIPSLLHGYLNGDKAPAIYQLFINTWLWHNPLNRNDIEDVMGRVSPGLTDLAVLCLPRRLRDHVFDDRLENQQLGALLRGCLRLTKLHVPGLVLPDLVNDLPPTLLELHVVDVRQRDSDPVTDWQQVMGRCPGVKVWLHFFPRPEGLRPMAERLMTCVPPTVPVVSVELQRTGRRRNRVEHSAVFKELLTVLPMYSPHLTRFFYTHSKELSDCDQELVNLVLHCSHLVHLAFFGHVRRHTVEILASLRPWKTFRFMEEQINMQQPKDDEQEELMGMGDLCRTVSTALGRKWKPTFSNLVYPYHQIGPVEMFDKWPLGVAVVYPDTLVL